MADVTLPIAAWKKHKTSAEWLVYAPGSATGDKVIVVAKKTGAAKKVLLKQPVTDHPGCFNYLILSKVSTPSAYIPAPKPLGSPLGSVKIGPHAGAAYPHLAPAAPKPAAPKTQKARGVSVLSKAGWTVPKHVVVDACEPIAALPLGPSKQFLRPCPPTPQHGFVDSRVVTSVAEAEQVRAETVAAVPTGAELMFMPVLTGEWSAIVTPAAIAIGPGHDAATSGHGKAVSFVTTKVAFSDSLLQSAGVASTDMPYCEVVEHGGKAMAVQLRSGPPIPQTVNAIPAKIGVAHILDARPYTDLLEWQTVAASIEPGTVVICSDLVCHQAAHVTGLILKGRKDVAVVCDGRPLQLGMILEPETIPAPDVDAFRQGLELAMPEPWQDRAALCTVLFTLHQNALLLTTPTGARLGGLAVRSALGMAAAALHGEARYFNSEKGKMRHAVYAERYADGDTDAHHLIDWFKHNGGGSVGGPNWSKCAVATVTLRDAVRACYTAPSIAAVSSCIDGLNAVVNVSHNNGSFLNKYGSGSDFNYAAASQAQWTAEHVTRGLWRALTQAVALPLTLTDRKHLRWESPAAIKALKKALKTYGARVRYVGQHAQAHIFRIQVIGTPTAGEHYQESNLSIPAASSSKALAAWEACKDNATLPSLAGSGAMYVPAFVRGKMLYLKRKEGWYVSTGMELDAALCPLTKKAKKAAKGGNNG